MNRRPMNPTMIETEKRPYSVRETIKLMNENPLPNSLIQTKEEYIEYINKHVTCPPSDSTIRYQVIDYAIHFFHCEVDPLTAIGYIRIFRDKVIKHRGLT